MDTVSYLYFSIFSGLFGLFILYLLFFSSLTLGFIVSKCIAAFLLPRGTFLRINSLHLSLLSGKVIFKGLKFATKNTSLRVVEGVITFRYWRKNIRQSIYLNENYPCRLSVSLEGVEYLIYNNSYKYDHIEEVINRRNGTSVSMNVNGASGSSNNGNLNQSNNSAKDIADDLMKLPAVKDFVIPRFYRLFSASSLSIRKGCLMLSNPELPTILVMLFDKGNGIYTTDAARIPELDYYRQITTMDLTNTKISLMPNKDYNGEEELFVERPQKEDFVSYAFESFKSVFKDFKFNFINTDENFETSNLPRRKGVAESNDRSGEKESITFDYGKHQTIITSPQVHIQYYCDIPGPVPNTPEHTTGAFKEFLAPQWGVDINFQSTTTIVYGPWADRNRTLLHKFFFPADYETPPIYRPVAGEQRPYASFNVLINFAKNSTFRIPFRELSKDGNLATLDELMARKPGWVDIKMEDNSTMNIISPMTTHKSSGSTMIMNVILNRCNISTSVTNTQLLYANCLKVFCNVDYPLVWNHLTEWRCSFNIDQPQIFLLSDHITLLKDLGSDWSAGEPVDITMFVPRKFNFDFVLTNFKLFCNVNEQNIINQPNNLDENAHYVFCGPTLKANLLLPYTAFQSPKTEITFNVSVTKLALKLILPLYNTIRQHLEDIELYSDQMDSSIGMMDPNYIEGSSQFISSDEFTLNGKYLYYQKVDPSYLDSVVLNIHGKNPSVKLFGFYVRYFLFLKNNFFGYTSHIINLEKYKDNIEKQKQQEGHNDDEEQHTSSEENISNGLEIYVSVSLEDATVFFPLGLYSSQQQATVGLHEFLLEIRYLPTYLDLYADFSPLVLNVPVSDEELVAAEEAASRDTLTRYIQINDFTFKLHFLYGPQPLQANYADFVDIHIGTISGHVLVSQITSLGIWSENFFFHLLNKDNALSTKLATKINPVYSILKLTVNTISLCLYSSENISEVRLPAGIMMHSNSLVDQLSHEKFAIEIPELSFKSLVPWVSRSPMNNQQHQQHHRINNKKKKWAEVGELKISANLSIYNKEPNWKLDSERQREFLLRHDSESRLLSFLWLDDDNDLDDNDFIVPSIFNNITLNTPKKSSSHHHPTTSNSITSLSPFTFSPQQQTQPTPRSIQSTPKQTSFLYPTSSSYHILKWTTNSPMQFDSYFNNSGGVGGVSHAMKSSRSNLDVSHSNLDDGMSIDDSQDDSDFRTPESSVREGDDDDDSEDVEDVFTQSTATLDESLYHTTQSLFPPSIANSSHSQNPLRSSTVSPMRVSCSTNNLKNILQSKMETKLDEIQEESIQSGSNQQQNQQLPQQSHHQPNNEDKNLINPEISALRYHLRNYFFNLSQARMDAFGSTSRASSFVEVSRDSKRMRHSASFIGRPTNQSDTNPHGSIHSISNEESSSFVKYIQSRGVLPPIPKRSPNHKLTVKYDRPSEDESSSNKPIDPDADQTSTTSIVVDVKRDIELFATPVIVTILEELVESFIAKDPSIDYMLDNFQLRTISEQFKVKKYLHNKIRLTLSMHKFNLHWTQALTINKQLPVPYTTELEVNELQVFMSVCQQQTHRPIEPSANLADSTNQPALIVQEEFCGFETSLTVKSIHGCIRANTPGHSLPPDLLSKYHHDHDHQQQQQQSTGNKQQQQQRIILSIGSENIDIKGKFRSKKLDGKLVSSLPNNNSTPNGAFTVSLGPISVFCTSDSPPVIFRVVDTWIYNISTLTNVIERYNELWQRQLQTLIGELMRVKTRSLHTSSAIVRQKLSNHRVGFIPPDFKEIIGDEALIHRLGWSDISRMRHFLQCAERPHVDEIVADVRLEDQYDAYQVFQELINEIYEIDEGGDLIHLFQSPLIKKVFIPPPGKSNSFDLNLQYSFAGIVAAVVTEKINSSNQLSIGTIAGGAVANYIYESTNDGALVLSKAVPKTLFDFSFFASCEKVSLKVSPDLLSFVELTTHEVLSTKLDVLRGEELILGSHEWKEAVKPKNNADSTTPTTPTSHHKSNSGNVNSTSAGSSNSHVVGSGGTKHKTTASSPNLNSVRLAAINLLNNQNNQLNLNNNNNNTANTTTTNNTTTPKPTVKKNKVIYQHQNQSILTITVHGHFSFKEINCRAFTENNGVMKMVLKNLSFVFNEFGKSTSKSKKAASESRPNGDYIDMIHSCIFSIPEIQFQLLDQSSINQSKKNKSPPTSSQSTTNSTSTLVSSQSSTVTNSNNNSSTIKPIIELTLQNLMFNEVLFKIGKKKTRHNSVGKREDYIEFAFKYDLMMTFSKADLPFKMSHRFLPKLKDFLKAWTPPENTGPAVKKPQQSTSSSGFDLKNIKFPPVRIKLDLQDIILSTDVISSLPVKYHISRITASLGQFTTNEVEFNVQLHQHHIVFLNAPTPHQTSKPKQTEAQGPNNMSTLTKDPFMLPRIKAFGLLKTSGEKPSLIANLEIGFIQNILSIELLENILLLRTTLSKEIDDLLDAYINYAEKKQGVQNNTKNNNNSSMPSILSEINYNFSFMMRGIEILFVNSKSSLLLSTGVIDVRLSNHLTQFYNQVINNNNEFNWRIGLRGLSMILSDPNVTLQPLAGTSRLYSIKTQIWAGVFTDIILQSFPFTNNLRTTSQSRQITPSTSSSLNTTKTSPLENAWIVISKTIVTLQPWAIDKATDLYLFYVHAYQATSSKLEKMPGNRPRETQMKRALNMELPSALPIRETNLSLHLKVVDTSLCIPLNEQKKGSSALVVGLGSFTLYGVAIKQPLPHPSPKSSTSTPPLLTNPIKVIGDCKFSKFSLQFVDNYHPSKLHSIHVLSAVNRGVIDNGDCQIVMNLQSQVVQCMVQLKTSGLFLHLDTNLLYYIVAFQDLILLGQEKIKNISGDSSTTTGTSTSTTSTSTNNSGLHSEKQSPSKSGSSANQQSQTSNHRLEIEFTLKTTTGEARLTKHAASEPEDHEFSQENSPMLDSFDRNADTAFANTKDFDQYQECFPLPPLLIATNHVLTPATSTSPKSKSETNIMLYLDSQEIKLTPFFTHFLYDLIHNAPQSSYTAQFNDGKKDNVEQEKEKDSSGTITTPGSVTCTIRISPTKVLLNGVDQILAIVEIGTLDIFLSSIIKSTTTNKRVLLMNGTLYLNNMMFKIMHSNSHDERLGMVMRSLQVNIGTAHGITEDGPVVSVLLNSDSAHGFFNSKYLDEIIILLSAWIPRSNKKIIVTPPPSPLKQHRQQIQQQQSLKKNKPQYYITLKLGSLGMDIDFLPISRCNMLVTSICAVFSPSEEEGVRGSLFYTSLYTGPISMLCHGKLEGNVELEGVALVGERKPYKKLKNTVKEINMWTAYLSPIRVSFDFNQSQILELRAGDIHFRFYDPPINESLQPDTRNINTEVSCGSLQVQLSCETITSIVEIIKRIKEMISDKLLSAKKHLQDDQFLSLNRDDSSTLSSQSVKSKPIVVGQIKAKGKNLQILLFGYSIKDPTWINFTLESYQITLDQSKKKEEIHRQLSILLGQNHISKMSEESIQTNGPTWARDPFSRRANETKIVKIPVASLIMYTTEHPNRTVEYYYLTEFTDSIAISVNLSLYSDIREIVQTYIKAATDLSPSNQSITSATPPLHVIGDNSPLVVGHSVSPNDKHFLASSVEITKMVHNVSFNNLEPLSNSMHNPKSRDRFSINSNNKAPIPQAQEKKRVFLEKKFQLSPTLNVLGDLTPKVTTVFGWLGIKDINYTIPYYTHVGLIDSLESVLLLLKEFSTTLNNNNSNYYLTNNINNNNNNNNDDQNSKIRKK